MFQQNTAPSFGFGAATSAPPAQAASTFSFGAAPAQQQQPGMMGAGAAGGTGFFGAGAAAQPQQQQQQRQAFGFGAALPTSTAAPGASLFGQPAATAATSTTAPGATLFGQPAAGSSLFGAKPATTAAPTGIGSFGGGSLFAQAPGAMTTMPGGGGMFGAAAQQQQQPLGLGQLGQLGPQSQYLQQQQQQQHQHQIQQIFHELQKIEAAWNPQNPLCNFKYYFYNMVHPNDAPLYQRPAQDGGLYEQAQANNPDPSCMVPVLAVGFDDLKKRMEAQQQQQQSQKQTLELISARVDALVQKHSIDTVIKIEECKRRHRQIVHKVYQLVKAVMLYRNRGYSIRADEEMLRARLEAMQRDLLRPSIFRGRLNEIWAQLNQLKDSRRINEEAAFSVVDEASLAPVAEALEGLHNGLAHLTSVLREDQQAVEAMYQGYSEVPFQR